MRKQLTTTVMLALLLVLAGCGGGSDTSDTNTTVDATGKYTIVDTKQSTCYDSATGNVVACSGIGYDADHTGIQASYTVSNDGATVYDNNTGLTWTQTPDVDGDGDIDVNDKMTLSDAETYCSGLSLGGLTWRLPSIKQLYSLMQFNGTDPSGYTGTDASTLTPFIESSVFDPGYGDTLNGERLIDGQYATTAIYVSPEGTLYGQTTMFGVNFADGRIKGYPSSFPTNNPKTFYVHCVSGNTVYGTNQFTDNGDGTVSDAATGLMWQQDDYNSTDFEDAIAYCTSLTLADRSDWRLPNIKELHSIVDYDSAPDYNNNAAIDPVFNATSFTNEEGETDWGHYWSSTTHATHIGNGASAAYVAFGRALGYFEQTAGQGDMGVVDVHGAGAQRSDDKDDVTAQGTPVNLGHGTFYYHGPQGDILRKDNYVRCVTDIAAI